MKKNRNYQVLEYYKIIEMLSEYTDSSEVKERINALTPYGDIEKARNAQKETSEAVNTLLRLGSPAVSLSVPNINPQVKRCEMGGMLNPKDLLEISRVLYVARRMKAYLSEVSEKTKMLGEMGNTLMTAKSLEDKINGAILS